MRCDGRVRCDAHLPPRATSASCELVARRLALQLGAHESAKRRVQLNAIVAHGLRHLETDTHQADNVTQR
jgi:hypothetical protein